jgi:hypothetical protein
VAPQPVPAFEAAASTVRVPAAFGTALRRATADLRKRLAAGGRRPAASTDSAAATALPGTGDPTAAPALAGTDALTVLVALTGLVGAEVTSAGNGPPPVTGPVPIEVRFPGAPGTQRKPSRPWARLARDYLTLVLTLLPRPRPAHTTITVYITTADGVVSERPGGSAP